MTRAGVRSRRSKDAGNVEVAVRIRPLLARERDGSECVEKVDGEPQIVVDGRRSFTYDFAFEPSSEQEEVYEQCVAPLVGAWFEGYNATVLAYGQTGSGKTYTMGSAATSIYLEAERGIIPRVISRVFAMIDERSSEGGEDGDETGAGAGVTFEVSVTFIEIYGEDVRDLLTENQSCNAVTVRELDGELVLVGATQLVVKSGEEMMDALERGSQMRVTASTHMNDTSSRSHAIFSISLSSTRVSDGDAVEAEVTGCTAGVKKGGSEDTEFRSSKFHFVDLAGSERAKRTGASGVRMREGININKGLLALGNVISSLGDEKKRAAGAHVPYRDSKLTRILQDSLGGNSRTLMVACVSPADDSMEETLNALKYANRARNIKNKPVINRDPRSLQLAALRLRISQLSADLALHGIAPSVGTLELADAAALTTGSRKKRDGVDWQSRAEQADAMLQRAQTKEAKTKVEMDRVNTERISAQAEREWYRDSLATAHRLATRLRSAPPAEVQDLVSQIIAASACGVPPSEADPSDAAATEAATKGISTIAALQAEVEELTAKLARSNAVTRDLVLSASLTPSGGADGDSAEPHGVYVDTLVEEMRAKLEIEREQLIQMRQMQEEEKSQAAAEGGASAVDVSATDGDLTAVNAAAAADSAAEAAAVTEEDEDEEANWRKDDQEKLRKVEHSFEQRQLSMRAEWQRAEDDIKMKEKLVTKLEQQQQRFVGMEKHYQGQIVELNERMEEAKASRTALVIELERLEKSQAGEEKSSASAPAAEMHRKQAEKLRRKLRSKDAQLAQLKKQRVKIAQISEVKRGKENEIRSLQNDIQRKRSEKVAVERRMNNEKKLFESKLRQHRIEIKAEQRNRRRLERELRALKLKSEKREVVLLRKNRALVSAQQRVRSSRRGARAGAREAKQGGARAAQEKERRSFTFLQSLLQRFSDSEQVNEELEDLRRELREKKAELKQRVQRREGVLRYIDHLSPSTEERIVDEAQRALDEESGSIDSLKAVVNHTGGRLRALRVTVGRYGELSEEAMLERIEKRFASRADSRMCTTILARMMLSQKRGENTSELDAKLLRDELNERTVQVRERQQTIVKQQMKLSKLQKHAEELEAQVFDMPSVDEIGFTLSIPRGTNIEAAAAATESRSGADRDAIPPRGGGGGGGRAGSSDRGASTASKSSNAPRRATSSSCESPAIAAATKLLQRERRGRFAAWGSPSFSESHAQQQTHSAPATGVAGSSLSPGVLSRLSNPREYAGASTGRQRYKAGQARSRALDATGSGPSPNKKSGSGLGTNAQSFMSKLRQDATTRLERYGGSTAGGRESITAAAGAKVAQQRLQAQLSDVATPDERGIFDRLASPSAWTGISSMSRIATSEAAAASETASAAAVAVAQGGGHEEKRVKESVQARRQRRSRELKAMQSDLVKMNSKVSKKTGQLKAGSSPMVAGLMKAGKLKAGPSPKDQKMQAMRSRFASSSATASPAARAAAAEQRASASNAPDESYAMIQLRRKRFQRNASLVKVAEKRADALEGDQPLQ